MCLRLGDLAQDVQEGTAGDETRRVRPMHRLEPSRASSRARDRVSIRPLAERHGVYSPVRQVG